MNDKRLKFWMMRFAEHREALERSEPGALQKCFDDLKWKHNRPLMAAFVQVFALPRLLDESSGEHRRRIRLRLIERYKTWG
jgi:hypothetical protein